MLNIHPDVACGYLLGGTYQRLGQSGGDDADHLISIRRGRSCESVALLHNPLVNGP